MKSPGMQKRRFPRHRDGQKATCYFSGGSFSSQVLDAGLGGLRIKTETSLSTGSSMSLALRFREEIAHFHVKVTWRKELQGCYEYGVQFSELDRDRRSPLPRYISHLRLQAFHQRFRSLMVALFV